MEKLLDGAWKHLADIRRATANIAEKEEEKAKDQMLHILKSVELELERTHAEHDHDIQQIIQRVEEEATERIHCAAAEMEEHIRELEVEIFRASCAKMEEEWSLRENALKEEFHSVLSAELERQHNNLSDEYEAALIEREMEMKSKQEELEYRKMKICETHQAELDDMRRKLDEVAEVIWKEANEAAMLKVSEGLEHAGNQCRCKDDEISKLREELSKLKALLNDKELDLRNSMKKLEDSEESFRDFANELNDRHRSKMEEISEDARALLHENDELHEAMRELESRNATLQDELKQVKSDYRSLKEEFLHQNDFISNINRERNDESHRNEGDLSIQNELKEQLKKKTSENQELSTMLEKQHKRIIELSLEVKDETLKSSKLSSDLESLQQKKKHLEEVFSSLEKKCADAMDNLQLVKQEKLKLSAEMEEKLNEKDNLLRENLLHHQKIVDTIKEESQSTIQSLKQSFYKQSISGDVGHASFEKLTSECNELRSRILMLQRENFRLESDLVDARDQVRFTTRTGSILQEESKHYDKDMQQVISENDAELQKLCDENTALKEMIKMMRNEMETVASKHDETPSGKINDESTQEESKGTLQKQVEQYRSYLNLLLRVETTSGYIPHRHRWRAAREEEICFLRKQYTELNHVIDKMRRENMR